ncbi:Flp pilus assembly protein CpaB [Sphingomonas oligoaromativorans]|uniref:Flp pilus assembly protein CpaB n=1 Tax=Sphingomonas oligoaromativorans TaxID=575322 RepID=UPI00142056E6|nr:Flp pilus assembly protein CpaB [Sphingomonas oligoaromativorans]NIJ31720.1 pilus assembly protein CpaB [Sphingomonas oligoaromativorans]
MDGKKLALLIGALFVAAVTAIMAKSMFGASGAPQVLAAPAPVPTGPKVLVATKPLPVGTILGPDAFRFQPWPKDLVDGAYYVQGQANADPAKMAGMVVRSEITAGQPLTQGALVSPQDRGFLAAALTPGMRAVTVPVGGATGVAGFVFPGDRVDLVLTQDVQANGDSGQPLRASETMIRNIRVLATDQRTDNQPTSDGKTDVRNFSMVTLEVTPKMAEKIGVAQKLGSLSLSLRPLADNTQELEQEIAAGDINVPTGTDPKAERKMLLDMASRPQDTQTTFTTGGEVSRFARSSMPRTQVATAAPAAGGSAAPAAPAFAGPVVRVARGNTVTDTPVGGK